MLLIQYLAFWFPASIKIENSSIWPLAVFISLCLFFVKSVNLVFWTNKLTWDMSKRKNKHLYFLYFSEQCLLPCTCCYFMTFAVFSDKNGTELMQQFFEWFVVWDAAISQSTSMLICFKGTLNICYLIVLKWTLTYFLMWSITVPLTSSLTGLDSVALLMLYWVHPNFHWPNIRANDFRKFHLKIFKFFCKFWEFFCDGYI